MRNNCRSDENANKMQSEENQMQSPQSKYEQTKLLTDTEQNAIKLEHGFMQRRVQHVIYSHSSLYLMSRSDHLTNTGDSPDMLLLNLNWIELR